MRSRAVVLALTAVVVGLAPAAYADHGGAPSAHEVAAGKATVTQREAEVRAAASAIARTQARLDRLATAAEVAVEQYNGARVKEHEARGAADVAHVVLDAAAQRVAAAHVQVDAFAKATYMGGGVSAIDAVLGSGGPATLFARVGTLNAISRSQGDAMQVLDAARVYQLSVQQQAQAALDRAAT